MPPMATYGCLSLPCYFVLLLLLGYIQLSKKKFGSFALLISITTMPIVAIISDGFGSRNGNEY